MKNRAMGDILVPLGVGGALAAMLLPVPPQLLDYLLVANLLLSLGLLIRSLGLREAIEFSSLPTVLLLATLVRLALNVSSTRLILSRGDAGQVIDAFGGVIVAGNLVVGLVVFLVVTMIQFIVIAKGAERIAEVSARFTLDAMPGKQMAIDSDMRSGLIDFETARSRRRELHLESRFFGALDGAMKFIKGDALAGIAIILINIIGGFAVGLLYEGLTLTAALTKFTTLTVGDGLISQIPALLNALAAGVVVTRVGGEGSSSPAAELVNQLFAGGGAATFLSVAALALSFVPGIPSLPCLAAGGLFLILTSRSAVPARPDFQSAEQGVARRTVPSVRVVAPDAAIPPERRRAVQGEADERLRMTIFNEWGLLISAPEWSFSADITALEVHLNRARAAVWADGGEIDSVKAADFLNTVCSNHLTELVDDQMTRRLLAYYERELNELISAIVPSVISVTKLTQVLRALIEERISVRAFDLILQGLAESADQCSTIGQLAAAARVKLGRQIVESHRQPDGKLRAYILDPDFDTAFIEMEQRGQIDTRLAGLLRERAVAAGGRELPCPVLVTSRSARQIVSAALRSADLVMPVLAVEELHSSGNLENCGVIKIEEGAKEAIAI